MSSVRKKAHKVTFGSIIAEARKQKKIPLTYCAAMILKEDGIPITHQYLSDIENDRRNPPSNFIIKQMSKILSVPKDILYFYADRFPEDIDKQVKAENILAAFQSFRKRLYQ